MAIPLECLSALRTLATTCAGIRAGESCLLVTDSGSDPDIVDAMAGVLDGLGCSVAFTRASAATLPGEEPPATVGVAMAKADVVFELTSVFIGSSEARRNACAGGTRYLSVPGLSWTTARPGGPFEADFLALGRHAATLSDRFDAAREFQLTSPLGTDLRGSFEGRRGRPLWGVASEPGGFAAPPDIEVGASPEEGTASGRVVVDGSVLFLGPDQLGTPIELGFDAGQLVSIEGREAWRLEDALARANDQRMTNLAEVSIGLNPFSRPGGSPLELEGIVGGAHVAVGNNVAYGGGVDAPSHIDCVLLEGTLALDGEPLDPRA
jgi:2,5-dihydroxypyridine 5,6-dioxygenase